MFWRFSGYLLQIDIFSSELNTSRMSEISKMLHPELAVWPVL
uniref:Hypotheticial protein n=1 Tax=Schistosoma japonicum TaxID=6182 RepID=C1LK19_SCHJA|nr:hypotheticial protein [Schistosoma japonicum]CAX75047.1 hypotheticial protein [Schistosoma japonicum]